MKYDPQKHHRKSIRLRGYDYSRPGAYFITINVHNRICRFGKIENGQMLLSDVGKTAYNNWNAIPDHFDNAQLDAFVIMPNHIHGIMILLEQQTVGIQNIESLQKPKFHQYQKIIPKSVGSILRAYKSSVTMWCNKNDIVDFTWQHNYYEHIIRNDLALNAIRKYILDNPLNWDKDNENPDRI